MRPNAHHRSTRTPVGGASPLLLLTALLALTGCTPPAAAPSPNSQPTRVPRIGYLTPMGTAPAGVVQRGPSFEAFLNGMGELGYVDGQNVRIEFRPIFEGEEAKLPGLAEELVGLPVDVIVAIGAARIQAAKGATQSIPIVMGAALDPVEGNLVESLARPGGNVTGVATLSAELAGKRLEILKQAVPSISRVAVLSTPRWNVPNSPTALQWRGTQEAAGSLGIDLQLAEAQDEGSRDATIAGIERAIASAGEAGVDALIPLGDALFDSRRTEVAAIAKTRNLPTIYSRPDFADPEAGGFIGHGPDLMDSYRKVAAYVDKILKGARPETLPVEQPERYELVLNVKTAEDLGLTFPESIRVQATRIVR
jgi:putative tryptophan/tyrosine transport system substrate-binding protein